MLRTQRSRRYIEALGRLDGCGAATSVDTSAIAEAIHQEFAEIANSAPLGLVGCCYLGPPFEVHSLSPTGDILHHFKAGEVLPGGLERARGYARQPTYLCVEVYTDRIACVRPDGSIVVLESGT